MLTNQLNLQMKNFYFAVIFFFVSFIVNAQEPFIITIDTNLGSNTLNLNTLYPSGYNFNFTIDLGNGNVVENVTENFQYTYSTDGVYTISISGEFPFFGLGECDKLISIEQWGDIVWQDMSFAFADCDNFVINATDTPNLSQVESMKSMFSLCDNFNHPINDWDVSNVTDMGSLFGSCTSFNQPLDNWDVSNVINMEFMFSGADVFNQPLNNWNVSSVESMREMFSYADSFNQALDNWDVSNVTNMNNMFLYALDFNQSLNNWDVSNVTTMYSMFFGASSFNQALNNWEISSLTSTYNMFKNASSFNQPLDNWDVSNITDFEAMFDGATSFNQQLDDWEFNNSIIYFNDFVNNSGLDVINYDDLLLRLASVSIENVQFGANGLEYCNNLARNYLINERGWQITGDLASLECNTLEGQVYFDFDNSGCNSGIYEVNGSFVQIDNGGLSTNVSVNNGYYFTPVVGINLNISVFGLPDYFSVSPETVAVDFTSSSVEQVDFCLTANQSVEDLNITILPIDDARPGFEASYKLVVRNVGTETISNITANLEFNDEMQSFVSSMPSETNSSTNSIDFFIASLNPFAVEEIEIIMQTFAPPAVNSDDVLSFVASVSPNTGDNTPDDNTFQYNQIAVNAFDPNDKQVLQGESITLNETDDYLDYIIRFQNTGSANATFVRIEDNLDEDLDWSTFQVTSASHNYSVEITNTNQVEFFFNNIDLPYESLDEPNSHGYIAYKIKPIDNIQVGDIMSGDASIFFDFNEPIITNIVSTMVVENLGVDEYEKDIISIYPNPFNDVIYLNSKNGVEITAIEIIDLQGKVLIKSYNGSDKIKTDHLSSGIYLLSIKTNSVIFNSKIIKN